MSETKEDKKEKCFVIMPISDQGDYPTGHFTKVYEQIIKPAIEDAGYEAYRVDENNICDQIINKIFSAIQECPMAVCDLSNRNPNVLYELGLRQAYDKPVVLIQDDKTEKIFDVSGISTVFYKSTRIYEDVIEARENIKKSIRATQEGRVSSLAKIMKVSTADFSQVEVSQDDKTNVMLEGIYSEIRELKSKVENDYSRSAIGGSNYSSDGLDDSNILKKNTNMAVSVKCSNQKKIEEIMNIFKKKLYGLTTMESRQITSDKWVIMCKFYDYFCLNMARKDISKIAIEFNLEYEIMFS